MKTASKFATSILAAGLLAVSVAACGDSVPSGDVAKVGDHAITKAQFDHWMAAAVAGSAAPAAPGDPAPPPPVAPDPPDYTACIADKKKAPVPKGTPAPTDAALKQQCQQQYELLKGQVMQFLLQSAAIGEEAKQRGVTVTDAEVQSQLDDLKDQTFKKESEYQDFLKTSGRNEADLLFQTRLDLLSNKLREDVTADEPAPTTAAIQKYYDENKDQPPLGQPETRDIELILAKTEEDANKAKDEIQGGASWASVTNKYSQDQVSKENGGKLDGVAKGQQEAALDTAVFSADKGTITGPIKSQFGWYVFRVDNIVPAKTPPLADVRDTIIQLLKQQKQQEALTTFVEDFQKRSTENTICAKGYEVQGCKNAPKTPAAPGVPGAPPTGAPPAGAPPTGAPTGAPPAGAPPAGAPPAGAGAPSGPPPVQQAPPEQAPPAGGGGPGSGGGSGSGAGGSGSGSGGGSASGSGSNGG